VTSKEIKALFDDLTVWRRGDQRAPHKPLLLLYALARCQHEDRRWLPYLDVDEALTKLLVDFGPPRKRIHPEYPFWRLQNDDLWVIPDADQLETRKSNTDAKKSELKRYNVEGGFRKDVFDQLRAHPELIAELAQTLLDAHFPASFHEDILSAVGLELQSGLETRRRARNPKFRERILQAYGYRCAVCSYDLRLNRQPVGLEAAHVKWHQAGGPDTQTNGLALCVMHHRLLDRGAWRLSEDYRLIASEELHGSEGLQEWILKYHNHPLLDPVRPSYRVETDFIGWHVREVFRGPERYRAE